MVAGKALLLLTVLISLSPLISNCFPDPTMSQTTWKVSGDPKDFQVFADKPAV